MTCRVDPNQDQAEPLWACRGLTQNRYETLRKLRQVVVRKEEAFALRGALCVLWGRFLYCGEDSLYDGKVIVYYGQGFRYYGEDILYYREDFLYYGEDFLYYGADFLY